MNKILSLIGALLLSVVASAQVVPFSISSDCSKNGQNVDLSDPHEAVDLGLPSGLKWANMNVGANTPEECGLYFAWGETRGYRIGYSHWFDEQHYMWYTGSVNFEKLTKYCTNSVWGTVDNKTVLDLQDDAARANWGDNWRMPTDAEWTELRTSCTWTWTTQNRMNGCLVTGPNGNSIFLCAAGYLGNNESYGSGWGYYWSSSLETTYNNCAYIVKFTSASGYSGVRDYAARYWGRSIRPVFVGENPITLTVYADGCDTPNTLTCLPGTEVELTAEEDMDGYTFSQWSDGVTDNPRQLTINADMTLTAMYAEIVPPTTAFTLTVYADGCDTPNTLTCLPGTEVELTADEDMDGYTFTQWSDGNTDNPRILTVDQNMTLTAVYSNIPAEYRCTTTVGRYGTICLPKGVAHENIQGGVFFNIVYAVTNTNMDITGILMEEETGDLVAGKPYIFRATTDELVLPYTGAAVANPLAANGLVGNLSETPLAVPQGMYVLSNNQIRKLAGGTATAGQNRAYIDLTNVTKLNYVPSAAPNRVMLNVEGSDVATDLENIQSKDVQKIVRDGQLLIIRDGKTYNVLGINL